MSAVKTQPSCFVRIMNLLHQQVHEEHFKNPPEAMTPDKPLPSNMANKQHESAL